MTAAPARKKPAEDFPAAGIGSDAGFPVQRGFFGGRPRGLLSGLGGALPLAALLSFFASLVLPLARRPRAWAALFNAVLRVRIDQFLAFCGDLDAVVFLAVGQAGRLMHRAVDGQQTFRFQRAQIVGGKLLGEVLAGGIAGGDLGEDLDFGFGVHGSVSFSEFLAARFIAACDVEIITYPLRFINNYFQKSFAGAENVPEGNIRLDGSRVGRSSPV